MNARPVSFKEFNNFIEENLHLTWYLGDGGGFDAKNKDEGAYIKYLVPHIDTRTMTIWRISSGDIAVSIHDNFDGTILELLINKINELRGRE